MEEEKIKSGDESGDSSDNSETIEAPLLKCFKCGKTDGIKVFNAQTLQRCKLALAIRKHFNLRTLTDDNVTETVLPSSADDPEIGYCSRPCYANFVSINPKYTLRESKK